MGFGLTPSPAGDGTVDATSEPAGAMEERRRLHRLEVESLVRGIPARTVREHGVSRADEGWSLGETV